MVPPDPAAFEVRRERTSRLHRLIPAGELDIATTPVLEREFDAVADIGDDEMIVVDLTELTFMDSTGLHALLRLSARFPGRLRVINGSRAVERVLDVSGVRHMLPIISSGTDPLTPLP